MTKVKSGEVEGSVGGSGVMRILYDKMKEWQNDERKIR
jgi:hypothetical protein